MVLRQKPRLLVVSCWWDFSGADGTSTQVSNLLQLLKNNFSEMHLLYPSRQNFQSDIKGITWSSQQRYFLPKTRIHTHYFLDFNPFFIQKLIKTVKLNKIEAIFFSFPWGIRTAHLIFPKLKLIHGCNDFEWVFAQIVFAKLPNIPRNIIGNYIGRIEKYATKKSDLTIAVSGLLEKELELNYKVKSDKIITIPMGFDFSNVSIQKKPTQDTYKKYRLDPSKKYFIFHGGLQHAPNLEAGKIIKNLIAPQIATLNNNIEFCIVGKGNVKKNVKNVHSYDFIEDLDEFISIMTGGIMPIVSGSGIRIKAMDYIKNKLPIVSTYKGIEGYGFTDQELIMVSNDIDNSFVEGILKIAQDPIYAKGLAEKCYLKAERHFNNVQLKNLLSAKLHEQMIV